MLSLESILWVVPGVLFIYFYILKTQSQDMNLKQFLLYHLKVDVELKIQRK